MRYRSIVLAVAVIFFALVAGSAWHKDDQCNAGVPASSSVLSSDADKPAPDSSSNKGDTKSQAKVIAYYFYANYRCVTCKKIEAYSKEAIETGFADDLAAGKLQFLPVNVQEPKNEHFVKDYQIYTKSLVICKMKDGKQVGWKNLAKVWELVRDKEAFIKYVQDEINAYLKEG